MLAHFALPSSYVYFCLCYWECSCLHRWILNLKKYSSYRSLCCHILLEVETDCYLLTLIHIWVCLSKRNPLVFVKLFPKFVYTSTRKSIWGTLLTVLSKNDHVSWSLAVLQPPVSPLSNFDWVPMNDISVKAGCCVVKIYTSVIVFDQHFMC